MSSSGTMNRPPPPPPPRPRASRVRAASESQPLTPVAATYLMNDIPRGTSRPRLMNFLLAPSHMDHATVNDLRPDVVCGIIITDSRLDDELSVATIEFSDTPRWLQELNRDPRGFPKSTVFGTIWHGVDRNETDTHGRTAFINAVISSNGTSSNLLYAEMLAEFSDTDVNIQDTQGRTALHWACSENRPDMVRLCLSVPECNIGLKDNECLTAFDISLQIADEMIPNLFYGNMFELEKIDPEAGLLRLLTVTSVPATDRAVFPGEAMFGPITNRNGPLVKALVERGIDLTTTNAAGQTGLYLATQLCDVDVMTMLLEAGADVNAPSMAGSTPLHCAAETGEVDVVQLLLDHGADIAAKDRSEKTALHHAEARRAQDVVSLLKAAEVEHRAELDLADLESQNADQFEDEDAQAALVGAVENGQVDPLSRILESQLPPSCELPMMEWVDAVDRHLITLISAPIDRNDGHFVKWDQYMAALDKNPALERMGDAIRKDKMFSFPRFRVPVILGGGRNNAKLHEAMRTFIPDDDLRAAIEVDIQSFSLDTDHKPTNLRSPRSSRLKRWVHQRCVSRAWLFRYPTAVPPHFKLFYVTFLVSHAAEVLVVAMKSESRLVAEYKCCMYQPLPAVVSRLLSMRQPRQMCLETPESNNSL